MEKYLKIYFWQVTSIVLNFVSLFVVTPYLSSSPTIYGIYMVVVSALIFLSYADLGFLSSGIKFASEAYARGAREEEMKVIGFAGFVLFVFAALFMAGLLYVSFAPDTLINNIATLEERHIASKLFLVLAMFIPIVAMQRIVQIVFSVRMKDYQFQKLMILANILKIGAAFFFFGNGRYEIIFYFICIQIFNAVAVVAGLVLMKRTLGYDLPQFFKSVRYSRDLYDKTKQLAFSSIVLTLSWIAYYELDSFVIGRLMGPGKVAVYAIGLGLTAYFRSLFGVMFSPFTARFNYFIGNKDVDGFKHFFVQVLVLAFPFTTFPVITFVMTAKPIVLGWVGHNYLEAVPIVRLLIASYVFSFISYPASILIMAIEKNKMVLLTSILLPLVYWVGIILFFNKLELEAFALFKLIAFAVIAVVYAIIIVRWLNMPAGTLFFSFLFQGIIVSLIIAAALYFLNSRINLPENKVGFFSILLINGLFCALGIGLYYLISAKFRASAGLILSSLFKRLKK
ncbi:lipopolysaccharide biosynthesis protein [uncultured Chitinophaga sp.]|uniref:lipopolysaccharide biosynthesis protein n=1 Tax=uncultured Chitinophaga sp. TaxID=339340 RepID=UPI0025D36F81|nr:lipopolysaccharide biosynthesis protein [uncultured Chitinophaga sp.]